MEPFNEINTGEQLLLIGGVRVVDLGSGKGK
jgi:hypothetical protein